MITQYYRPSQVQEALDLLADKDHTAVPLAGGTVVSHLRAADVAVVDLQSLHLDRIEKNKNEILIGSCVTLQELCESDLVSPKLREASKLEANRNIRNIATIGGSVLTADGSSVLTAVLLALNTRAQWEPGKQVVNLHEMVGHGKKPEWLLMTGISFSPIDVAFSTIRKSPRDVPMILAARAKGADFSVIGGRGLGYTRLHDGDESASIQKIYKKSSRSTMSMEYFTGMALELMNRCREELA